jgi:hypothetical protein
MPNITNSLQQAITDSINTYEDSTGAVFREDLTRDFDTGLLTLLLSEANQLMHLAMRRDFSLYQFLTEGTRYKEIILCREAAKYFGLRDETDSTKEHKDSDCNRNLGGS